MGDDIFDLLCCICMCLCDDDSKNCCAAVLGIASCFGQMCACYKKNISGNSKRRFKVLNKFMLFIFSIIAVVLSAITLSKYISITENTKSIFENWQLGAIIDIKIQNGCPPEYSVLSVYTSPATKLGCVCEKETNEGSCNDWDTLNGCTNIQPQDPISLSNWVQLSQNGYQSVQICGRRSNITFYDLLEQQIVNEQDCENNGYKVCKTENIENSYCVQQNEECPIRGFIIQQNELNEEEIQINNYEKIYDQGFYSYISKTQETFPIVQGIIVKGEGVCLDEDEISLNSKLETDYELLTPSPTYCQLDNTFEKMSTVQENLFFQYNYATLQVQRIWPHYEINNNIFYKLMFQNQIFYKMECRKTNYQQLKDIPDYFAKLKTITICQTVFACLFFFVMIHLLVADISRICYEDCKCISKLFYLIMQFIFLYLLAVTIVVLFAYTSYITPIIQNQYDSICFDVSSQQKLKLILDSIKDQGQSYTQSLFIICVIIVVIDFLMQTYICFKKVKVYKYLRAQKTINQNYNQSNKPNLNQNQEVPTYLQIGQNQIQQNQVQQQYYDQNNPYIGQQNINQNPYLIPQNFNQSPYQNQVNYPGIQNQNQGNYPYLQNQNQLYHPYQQNYEVNNQQNIPQYVDQQPFKSHEQIEPKPLDAGNTIIQF